MAIVIDAATSYSKQDATIMKIKEDKEYKPTKEDIHKMINKLWNGESMKDLLKAIQEIDDDI